MNRHSHVIRFTALSGVAALLVVGSACTVGPNYHAPSAPAPPAFKEAPPAGWQQAQPLDGTLRGKWWTMCHDATLNQLEEQVSISNQNVLAAEAQFQEARAAISAARSGEFPQVGTAPSASYSGSGAAQGVKQFYTIPLSAVYQADVWGAIRRTVADNSAVAQASAAQLENAKLVYQSELAADYFEIQGLDATQQLLEATVKSYQQYVQLTQDRYEGGVASMGDVALAKTQLETARAQLTDLGIQRAQFEHAIAVLTGRPPAEVTIAPAAAQSSPPPVAAGLPSALLERRPDIAAAERQVAAANEEIGVATAALYPSLTLSAGTGSQVAAIGNLLTWPSRFWSVGPELAETLFDAGKRRAQVRLTQAAYDATVANYRQVVLTAFQQVEDALAQLRILAQEADVTDAAVKAAKESLDIATVQYRSGTANYLQVITAQTAELQNQRAAVDIQARRLVASVALVQALGGGWDTSQLPAARDLR